MNLEAVGRRRSLSLAKKSRIDSIWRSEKKKRLVDEMRAQIEEQSRTWEILLAPRSWLQVRSETIKSTLVLCDPPDQLLIQNLLDCEEVAVPPTILKHAQYPADLAREFDEAIRVRRGISERLVNNHMLPCLQGAGGNFTVRRVRGGDNYE